jgi:hypothetical protein
VRWNLNCLLLFEQVVVGKIESEVSEFRLFVLFHVADLSISIALSVLHLDWARSVTALSWSAALGQSTRSTPVEDRPTFFIDVVVASPGAD